MGKIPFDQESFQTEIATRNSKAQVALEIRGKKYCLYKVNDCKDRRNKREVPDPMVKDLISDKIRKRNKSKADLTVENFV